MLDSVCNILIYYFIINTELLCIALSSDRPAKLVDCRAKAIIL